MSNNDGRMRLVYNYTTGDAAVYPGWAENIVLFGESPVDDEYHTTGDKIINDNDSYAVYDVNHWTSDDMSQFMNLDFKDQVVILEELDEIFEDMY